MDKQKVFFENLKSIKDYWVDTATDRLDPKTDLVFSDLEEDYRKLQTLFTTDEDKQAFKKVMNDILMGAMHSTLVMIDGGDKLADTFNIDLIDEETKESLKENSMLHEEFYSYLVDVEE